MQQQRWRCLDDNRFDLDDGCRNDDHCDEDNVDFDFDFDHVDHFDIIHSATNDNDRRSLSDG